MKLPTKWSDVRLFQYIEISDIMAIDMDDIDKHVKIVSILSGEKESTILDLSLSEMKECIKKVSFIYTKPERGAIKQYIRIGKHKYSINHDLKKITAGEYIDLTSLIKDDKTTQNLPQILAIFFHPVNYFGFKKRKCYENQNQTLESRIKSAKVLGNLKMDDVLNLSGFFLHSSINLLKGIQDYSTWQMKKAEKSLKKAMNKGLQNTGVGI